MLVDGVPFESLPSLVIPRADQQGLSIVRTAFEAQFPVKIPKKIVPEDTRHIGLQLGQNLVDRAGGWNKIGEDASNNASVAANNFSATMQDVGSKLQTLGLSAWEAMFVQKGVDANNQPTGSAQRSSVCEEGGVTQPTRSMPTRSVMNSTQSPVMYGYNTGVGYSSGVGYPGGPVAATGYNYNTAYSGVTPARGLQSL